jgi:hypothetical protein
LITGVISVPATTVRVRHSGTTTPVVVDTVNSANLPGFWFLVAQVPVEPISAIEALDANGSVLLQADPANIPQGP